VIGAYRSNWCGEVSTDLAGQRVRLAGWVHKRRDHGGLIFVDLRDRTGLVQLVFSPEKTQDTYRLADQVRSEFVVSVEGIVVLRPEGRVNDNIATGRVEVMPDRMEILNPAKTPPIYIEDDADVDEVLRLKYRYLDLRRPYMYNIIALRHKVAKAVRDYLDDHNFLEIETPMLTRSTPEGARDYLVPSRVNPGEFYALPQSPQLFKQILMVAGMERYFQIVKCFRDEDLRADRQPEFTQIDIEMSYVTRDDVFEVAEGLTCYTFEKTLGKSLPRPFQRMTWDDAMARYGSDKPDLRFGMEIVDLTLGLTGSDFRVFADTVAANGVIRGINASGCGHFSRKDIDSLTERAKALGSKGLMWLALSGGETKSSFAKFISGEELLHIKTALDAKDGDLLLLAAGPAIPTSQILGGLRLDLGRRLGLMPRDRFAVLWVTDFPLFELSSDGAITSSHHPFTAPRAEDLARLEESPLTVKSDSYDLVINGYETAGGSIRIHRRDTQEQIFKVLGLTPEETQEKFRFLLEAFEYGAPPHGGVAFGLDRLVMTIAGTENIRDVIAFPKTTSASDLMVGAPSRVPAVQLDDLHLKSTV
jgi:aspartyl-tRNA synthetase